MASLRAYRLLPAFMAALLLLTAATPLVHEVCAMHLSGPPSGASHEAAGHEPMDHGTMDHASMDHGAMSHEARGHDAHAGTKPCCCKKGPHGEKAPAEAPAKPCPEKSPEKSQSPRFDGRCCVIEAAAPRPATIPALTEVPAPSVDAALAARVLPAPTPPPAPASTADLSPPVRTVPVRLLFSVLLI